jgi:type II secretory pathway pseudopilin PulG
MNRFCSASMLVTQRQRGWIMLEVILCLALFAVVLHVSQRQSEMQWQSLQQAQEQRKRHENEQKRVAMMQLVGPVAWINQQPDTSSQAYPDCQKCTGSQLEQWFYTAQDSFSSLWLQSEEGER